MRRCDDAIAVLVTDEELVVAWQKTHRSGDVGSGTDGARQVVEQTSLLVAEGPKLRCEPLERRTHTRRHLPRELCDVRERRRPEGGEAPPDQRLERVLLPWPLAACDPVACRNVGSVCSPVLPVPSRRCRHEIGVGAHEPPHEPAEGAAEGSADARLYVLEDLLLRTRLARERDRERSDLLRIHPIADLETIPRAALKVLRRDRVGVEVSGRDQVQRAAHQPRADDVMPFDRRPELFATEVHQA